MANRCPACGTSDWHGECKRCEFAEAGFMTNDEMLDAAEHWAYNHGVEEDNARDD